MADIRHSDFRVLISYVPPLRFATFDKFEGVQEVLKAMLGLKDCEDFALCYATLYGGIVIERRRIVIRRELEGYVSFKEGENCRSMTLGELSGLIDGDADSWCVKLGDSVLSYSRRKREGWKWIDNVGLRVVVL
ncbi:MAG: hypothetical protein ACP5HQ_05380 [Thermoprotei archaeon]